MTTTSEPIRHILVASDFSEASHGAVRWAITLAPRSQARISLIHAVHAPVDHPADREVPPEVDAEVRRQLAGHETAIGREGIAVESMARPGKPWEVIAAAAQELAPDLVILGSVGHSAYARVRLGSTADRVIRTAPAPVLTVRGKDDAAATLKGPVVIATDFSEESGRALHETLRLVRALPDTPRILLLHACDFPVEYGIAASAEVIATARDEEAEAARHRLEDMAAALRNGGLDVETSVREGLPATVIEERIDELDASLVALGTQGRSGLSRLMMGSVAERVLHHAACPVLTVNHAAIEAAAAVSSKTSSS